MIGGGGTIGEIRADGVRMSNTSENFIFQRGFGEEKRWMHGARVKGGENFHGGVAWSGDSGGHSQYQVKK